MRHDTLKTRAETLVSTKSFAREKLSVKCCKQVNRADHTPAAAVARPLCLLISAVGRFGRSDDLEIVSHSVEPQP
jgi:hypothetical protein